MLCRDAMNCLCVAREGLGALDAVRAPPGAELAAAEARNAPASRPLLLASRHGLRLTVGQVLHGFPAQLQLLDLRLPAGLGSASIGHGFVLLSPSLRRGRRSDDDGSDALRVIRVTWGVLFRSPPRGGIAAVLEAGGSVARARRGYWR